jgi:hypothetical protein
VIISNLVHSEKHSEHKISTDFGISIRFNLAEANANDSIRFNVDGDSNVITSNDVHS